MNDNHIQEWLPQYAYEEYEPEDSGNKESLQNTRRRNERVYSLNTNIT